MANEPADGLGAEVAIARTVYYDQSHSIDRGAFDMSRKSKDKSKRKNIAQDDQKRSSNRTILIVIGILVFSAAAYLLFSPHEKPKPVSTVPMNADTLPGIQMNEAPWIPEMSHLRNRLEIIGLPALHEEGAALHAHQHLDLFIRGKAVSVPGMIGVNVPEQFISPVHTHDGTGEIHIESPTVQTYTLGQFFDIWGVRLNSKCIGAYCEDGQNSIKVFVNGKAEGDPRAVELRDHIEIVVTYGTDGELPKPIPSDHLFTPGA
jgi:hypothetical protein